MILRNILLALCLARHCQLIKTVPANAEYDIINTVCELGLRDHDSSGPLYGNGTFTQPLDHGHPDLGEFEEFFYWNKTFWRGPGAPIVVFLPGETSATGFQGYSRPEYSLVGMIANNLGAAVIIPEHRYYGRSSPFTELSPANLSYLTVDNSLRDIVNLAQRFRLPWAENVASTATDVPWILIGGSYSAAQTAWIANTMSGVFWVYLASSPLIQAIPDYWEYTLPQLEYGPRNCTSNLIEITSYVETVLETGSDVQVHNLKELFGLQDMEHDDDFMYQLALPLMSWDEHQFFNEDTDYEHICDRLEGRVSGPNVTHGGVSAEDLEGKDTMTSNTELLVSRYAAYIKEQWAPGTCYEGKCESSYDTSNPTFTDSSVTNPYNRQMEWLRCNEGLGGWIAGAPLGTPTLISRRITQEYWFRQCALYFPPGPDGETYGAWNAARTNAFTGGWSPTKARRIIYSSGEKETWREMTVSARLRPGGPLRSDRNQQVVVHVIPGGWHHSDLQTQNADINQDCRRVRDQEIKQVCEWTRQWPGYGATRE